MKGRIKRIVSDRGFGFIRAEDGQEVFFHRSGLMGIDFNKLAEGQQVEFQVKRTDRGPRAVDVRSLD